MLAVDRFLARADAVAPGFVEGLYLTGSLALGDYQPLVSDIDAVCVGSGSLEVMAQLHEPGVDVLFLSADDLLRDPTRLSRPQWLMGSFEETGAFSANPVTWRELTGSIAVRGPSLSPGDVWFDPRVLASWNVENLESYWVSQVAQFRRGIGDLTWLVLGVPRLHYTIATGEVTSKTGAGAYALEIAPARWHPVVQTALSLRARQDVAIPAESMRDACELAEWLIADARRVFDLSF